MAAGVVMTSSGARELGDGAALQVEPSRNAARRGRGEESR